MSTYALSKKRTLERIFVFQAVEYGYLTHEQLKECIDNHEQRESSVPLLTICKEKKYLKPSQVNHLMSKRLDSSVARAFVEYNKDQMATSETKATKTVPAPQPEADQTIVIPPEGEIVETPVSSAITEEELNALIEREQKQKEFFKRKIEDLEAKVQNFEQEKQDLLANKQKEITTLESELSCYKGLSKQLEQVKNELSTKMQEKEAIVARERQKSQSLFNLVEQGGKELRESEELRLKAEGNLQKKYKEIEYVQEKLEKENKEKQRFKQEFQEKEDALHKLGREMEKLKNEYEELQKTKIKERDKETAEPASKEENVGKQYQELTRQLERKDTELREQEKELEERQKELSEKIKELQQQNEELIENARQEKKKIEEQYEQEKSEQEEQFHKLRISLETDLAQFKEKSDQLSAKLQHYEESLKGWDELERQKKELEDQLAQKDDERKLAQSKQIQLEDQLKMLKKEMEGICQMVYNGELEKDTLLLGSNGERYRVQNMLGRGGMGITYSAERFSDNNIVVIKTLLPEAMADLKVLMRFVQEARTIIGFDHENLVHGYDIYQGDSFSYFVMEFLDGESVEDILEEQVYMEPVKATHVVLGIARALEYMEKHHLVHRDVKPSNIIIHSDGNAKLVDFGIVKMTDRTCSLTTEGIILGTPYYLSPEQTYETDVDIRSDIYSLGATYYHMVVGDVPFTGDNPIDVIQKRLVKTPKPGRAKPDLPKEVCNIIEKMMNRNIKKRHGSAGELAQELEKVLKKISRR